MAKARVVFAEGSKAHAHNLDDLRLRWLLRKQAWSEVESVPPNEITDPNYLSMSDRQEITKYQFLNSERLERLRRDIYELREQRDFIGERLYYLRWQTITAEIDYRKQVVRRLKALIPADDDSGQRLSRKIHHLKTEVSRLEELNKRLQHTEKQLRAALDRANNSKSSGLIISGLSEKETLLINALRTKDVMQTMDIVKSLLYSSENDNSSEVAS